MRRGHCLIFHKIKVIISEILNSATLPYLFGKVCSEIKYNEKNLKLGKGLGLSYESVTHYWYNSGHRALIFSLPISKRKQYPSYLLLLWEPNPLIYSTKVCWLKLDMRHVTSLREVIQNSHNLIPRELFLT